MTLKEATSDKHKKAERMPFNVRMFRGLLSKKEYLLYLNQQLQIFKAIERIGLPYKGLERVNSIQEDMDELINQGFSAEDIMDGTGAYTDYIDRLSYEQVLPHVYLNYMAIMFGGQMMKGAVPSSGKMYVFDNMQEAVQSIRMTQKDEWAEEVNKGFDFMINIFDELEAACQAA